MVRIAYPSTALKTGVVLRMVNVACLMEILKVKCVGGFGYCFFDGNFEFWEFEVKSMFIYKNY